MIALPPVLKVIHRVRYYDAKGFERVLEGSSREALEDQLTQLIIAHKTTLRGVVFSESSSWIE
jgi:hypothetical protein